MGIETVVINGVEYEPVKEETKRTAFGQWQVKDAAPLATCDFAYVLMQAVALRSVVRLGKKGPAFVPVGFHFNTVCGMLSVVDSNGKNHSIAGQSTLLRGGD